MSLQPASFPADVWDGTSTYNSREDDKSPDYILSDRIISELIAVQEFLIEGALLPPVGAAGTLLGVADDGATLEYKSLAQGANITLTNIDGVITISATGELSGEAAWGAITGTLSAQTDLQNALNAKAAASHTHTTADITGLTATVTELNYTDGVTSSIQTQLDGKAASSHTHLISQITGLQAVLDGKAEEVHTHAISDITDLQDELDGKANTSHSHTVADITGLTATVTELNYTDGVTSSIQTQLDGKAASSHSHTIANITGLQTALDGKAAVSHTHNVSDINGLTATVTELNYTDGVTSSIQTQLDGKAPTDHDHAIADVTGLQSALDDLQTQIDGLGGGGGGTWGSITGTLSDQLDLQAELDDLQDQIDLLSGGGGGATWGLITGTLADQTDLQDALDDKADLSHTHLLADITDITASATELNYVDGVTSSIQTQLNGKAASSHTHSVSDINALTVSRALVTDGTGLISVSSVTSTEIGYLSGVSSGIQSQLDGKAASSHTHTVASITDLTASATELNYTDGVTSNIQTQLNGKANSSHTHALTDLSALTAARALVSDGSGVISVSSVTSTELGYLSGATSNIQDQIDALAGGGMAIEKDKLSITQLTASGNSSTIDVSDWSRATFNIKQTNGSATISAGGRWQLQIQPYNSSNWFDYGALIIFPTTASTTFTKAVPLPPDIGAVRAVYTHPTGGSSHAGDADVSVLRGI